MHKFVSDLMHDTAVHFACFDSLMCGSQGDHCSLQFNAFVQRANEAAAVGIGGQRSVTNPFSQSVAER